MTLRSSPDAGLAKDVCQPGAPSAARGPARAWSSTGNPVSTPGAALIKVGIADDHDVVRRGLRQYLSDHDDMQVVAEVCNGREALEMVRKHALDVVTLDLAMPGYGGLDVLSNLKIRAPQTGVLVLSGLPEERYALLVLEKGASAYLNKNCDPEEIVQAIRTIAGGKRYFSSAVANLLADQFTGVSPNLPHQNLSDRQLQVFLRLARGHTIDEIATELSISAKSAHKLRLGVKRILQATSNSDMTYYALKHRLIQ